MPSSTRLLLSVDAAFVIVANKSPKPFSSWAHRAFLAFLLAIAFRRRSLNFMDQLNVSAMLKLQRTFVNDRKWKRFHTPKNLSMALAGEAAELMEIFQWLGQAESRNVMGNPAKARAVAHELADVFYYLLRLADVLEVDLEKAFWEKMRHNEAKYPVKLARGNAKKYNELLRLKGLDSRRRSPTNQR